MGRMIWTYSVHVCGYPYNIHATAIYGLPDASPQLYVPCRQQFWVDLLSGVHAGWKRLALKDEVVQRGQDDEAV